MKVGKLENRVYRQCVDIIKACVDYGCVQEVPRKVLRAAIKLKRGGDPRTFENWLDNLTLLGFLLPKTGRVGASGNVSVMVFKLNLERCSAALEPSVKGVQTHL